ncbi:hypothetical protein M9H77_19221 [Catharanthus roseus]|uniref:Uncharacterized protein n=1 Tax=Catharanthus roseus TaxID=4058 RepID=A0ACC0B9Z8_CATRO|nr:hypothetical protein M9H77_19221 [Catharanthus roseus]
MPVTRQRSKESAEEEVENEMIFVSKEESPPTEMEVQRKKLRQSWELASVLNFFNVFEPVIESNLKISAEEIETALIEPNDSLSQLHMALLKGVVPPKKSLDASKAWLPTLSNSLAMWWPWVAEGDFPLTAVKGEEMSRYKQLDPTVRLSILKALCEVRAEQNDIVSYINDTIKNGNTVSTFRKEKLGDDGNGTIYWYDGNAITGHRLYKEVYTFKHEAKAKDKDAKAVDSQWETLATNLEEFQKLANELLSSELHWEVSIGKAVETDAIPALKKLQRKKDRLLKLQEKQDMLLNGVRASRITRSGRNCGPVSYKFEDYDRAIKEAIEVTQKGKTADERGHEDKNSKRKKGSFSGDSDNSSDSDFVESDTNTKKQCQEGENNHRRNNGIEVMTNDKAGNGNNSILPFKKLNGLTVYPPKGQRFSERLWGTGKENISETMSFTTKKRLRQRLTINTAAAESADGVPDSEDEEDLSKDNDK